MRTNIRVENMGWRDKYYTTKEAAEKIGVTPLTLLGWAKCGDIPHIQTRWRKLFDKEYIDGGLVGVAEAAKITGWSKPTIRAHIRTG